MDNARHKSRRAAFYQSSYVQAAFPPVFLASQRRGQHSHLLIGVIVVVNEMAFAVVTAVEFSSWHRFLRRIDCHQSPAEITFVLLSGVERSSARVSYQKSSIVLLE